MHTHTQWKTTLLYDSCGLVLILGPYAIYLFNFCFVFDGHISPNESRGQKPLPGI